MHRRPSQSFERSNISCRRNLLFYRLRFSPNSDCICTESNLHVFCSKRYTGSVSISIETSAKNKIRIHSAYPGPRSKDARDVSTDLTLHYSILPVRRTGHVYYLIYKAQIVCLCVCVCVCMFAFGGHVFCPFETEIGTHTRYAQAMVCVKKFKKLRTGSPLEGSTLA